MFVSIESIEMGRRPFLAVFMTLEICVRFLFTFQRHHHGPSPPNECLSLRSLLLRYFFCLWWLGPVSSNQLRRAALCPFIPVICLIQERRMFDSMVSERCGGTHSDR